MKKINSVIPDVMEFQRDCKKASRPMKKIDSVIPEIIAFGISMIIIATAVAF